MSSLFYKYARMIHRWLLPVVNVSSVIKSFKGIYRYPIFLVEYLRYRSKSKESVRFSELYPCLHDRSSASQTGCGHYFYQDIWALARIIEQIPTRHVDIGSRIDGFAGQLSAFCKVEYVDIRPVELGIENFEMVKGSLLQLPYADKSVPMLSCLHVIEHVGLGRYGDTIDPEGSYKSARELVRVLAPGGNLLVGVPIGRERVLFNAHRVFSPVTVQGWFSDLRLIEFSVVTDEGIFKRFVEPQEYLNADYACGLYMYSRKVVEE